jgi:hypothetical protein
MNVDRPNLPGRAHTPEQKRAIIERVLATWEAHPQQRLGQLIGNVLGRVVAGQAQEDQIRKLYYIEDQAFAEMLERGP